MPRSPCLFAYPQKQMGDNKEIKLFLMRMRNMNLTRPPCSYSAPFLSENQDQYLSLDKFRPFFATGRL